MQHREDGEDDDELGAEVARLCAIKGQHQRRIKDIESQATVRVSFCRTETQHSVCLQAGKMTSVPWHDRPVVWCPSLPEAKESIVHLTQDLPFDIPPNELMFVFGGKDSVASSCGECYDVESRHWSLVTCDMPSPRMGHAAVSLAGQLYVIGGWNGSDYMSSVDCFDPVSQQWSSVSPMTKPIQSAAAAVASDRIYVVGGWTSSQGASRTVQCYDLAKKTWSITAPLGIPRYCHNVVTISDRLYAIGGRDRYHTDLDSVEVFDKTKWSFMPNMPSKRSGAAAVELGGKIYVLGGQFPDQDPRLTHILRTVECFDPRSMTWSIQPPMSVGRYRLAAVVMRGRIYAIGGGTPRTQYNTVECFDPSTCTWTMVEPMTTNRQYHAAVTVTLS